MRCGSVDDDGRGHDFLLEAWSSFLADLPCAVFLVDRGHVSGLDALEEGERLLEERRLRVRLLAIVVGVFSRNRLNLPREPQHVAEHHQGALQMKRRGHEIDWPRLDPREIASRYLHCIADRVSGPLLEEETLARDAGLGDEICHHRGLAFGGRGAVAVTAGRDDREARSFLCEMRRGSGARGRGGRWFPVRRKATA